jgi:hypothetical protein
MKKRPQVVWIALYAEDWESPSKAAIFRSKKRALAFAAKADLNVIGPVPVDGELHNLY